MLSGGDEVLRGALETLWSEGKAWLETQGLWQRGEQDGEEEGTQASMKACSSLLLL